jgi:inner membrane protein
MNILTHGLASLALMRGGWPRAPKRVWILALVAGMGADVDLLSGWFGAAAWWKWRGTCTHSLLASALLSVVCAAVYRVASGTSLREKFSVRAVLVLTLAAGLLHLTLDVCGSDSLALLWPFSARRFALDWVANLDPLIIAILLIALLLPELARLVSSEIGARDKQPRGRIGAWIGLGTVVLYLGMRAHFHSNVLALMDARTFHGETAKRIAAFPEVFSPLAWRGVVETESALHLLGVSEGPAEAFDPERAETFFKPEATAALEAVSKTPAAELFLKAARFPEAAVEGTATGTRVEIRDLRYVAVGESKREVIAVIDLDGTNRVVTQELVWRGQLEGQ